jgi:hypothetical protein
MAVAAVAEVAADMDKVVSGAADVSGKVIERRRAVRRSSWALP